MKLRIIIISVLILLVGLFVLISRSSFKEIKWDDSFKGGIHILLEVETRGNPSLDEKNTESIKRITEYKLKALEVKENERIVKNLGNRMVVIQLPYTKYNQRAVDILCRFPFIKFKFVKQVNEDSESSLKDSIPEGYELRMLEENGNKKEILVEKKAVLEGGDIRSVNITEDSDKKPILRVGFEVEGSKKLAKLTKENIGRRLAVILDEKVLMAPRIREEIPNGELVVTGNFSLDEIKDLEIMFRAGTMPAPVKVVEVGELTESNWKGGRGH